MLELPAGVRLVLASGSVHRARLLASNGLVFDVDPPGIDERSSDVLLASHGPSHVALDLARRKAAAVAGRHPGAWIVAADQIGVVGEGDAMMLLCKQDTVSEAVAQLVAISGSTHRLVNAVVVTRSSGGPSVEGVDLQEVTMRDFTAEEATRYVEAHRPFDSVGCYRIEDDEHLAPRDRLVVAVRGEDPSGVIGLPLPLLGRLFGELAQKCRSRAP